MEEPVWYPSRKTISKMYDNMSESKAEYAFRQSSSALVYRSDVRKIVFDNWNNKCAYCESTSNLQVDHIVSVHRCFKDKRLRYCNSIENLQILCRSCNAAKLP